SVCLLIIRLTPTSTLFPYTTLFRSSHLRVIRTISYWQAPLCARQPARAPLRASNHIGHYRIRFCDIYGTGHVGSTFKVNLRIFASLGYAGLRPFYRKLRCCPYWDNQRWQTEEIL